MTDICCKRCGATDDVKNGIMREMQRTRCTSCGCDFTATPARGKPPELKAWALLRYAMGNMSFCGIARVLGVSDVAVLNWVRAETRKLPDPPRFPRPSRRRRHLVARAPMLAVRWPPSMGPALGLPRRRDGSFRKSSSPAVSADQVVVTLDEMWHFLEKRLASCGFGEPMTLWLGEPSPLCLVAVMTPHAGSSSTRSASSFGFAQDEGQDLRRRSSGLIRGLGRHPSPDPGGSALHRQGPDLPDRARQQQHPPLPRPLPAAYQGRLQVFGDGRFALADLPLRPRQPGQSRRPCCRFLIYL